VKIDSFLGVFFLGGIKRYEILAKPFSIAPSFCPYINYYQLFVFFLGSSGYSLMAFILLFFFVFRVVLGVIFWVVSRVVFRVKITLKKELKIISIICFREADD